jgi:hypothetical protein
VQLEPIERYRTKPWTAAACVKTVRMKEKSIVSVARPAPCAARFLPNLTNLSHVMSLSFVRPTEALSVLSTMHFDRRTGLPT